MQFQSETAAQLQRAGGRDAAGAAGNNPHSAATDFRVGLEFGRLGHRILQPPDAADVSHLVVDRFRGQFPHDIFGQEIDRLVVGRVDRLGEQSVEAAHHAEFEAEGLDQARQCASLRRGHAPRETEVAAQSGGRHQGAAVQQPGLQRPLDPPLAQEIRADHATLTLPLPDGFVEQISLAPHRVPT